MDLLGGIRGGATWLLLAPKLWERWGDGLLALTTGIKGLYFRHPSLSLLPLKRSTESTLGAQSQDLLRPVQLPRTVITAVLLSAKWLVPPASCQLTHSGAPMALEIRFGLDAPLPRLCLMTHPSPWQQQG